MHSTVSDGTDKPEEILQCVKDKGIRLFSLTDHDAIKGAVIIRSARTEEDPQFLTGVEFSCRDEEGKYHILGYGYDPDAESIQTLVGTGHAIRMRKVRERLEFLEETYNIRFPEEEVDQLLSLDNPGKPQIGNLMVRYGYAESKEQAIREYINQYHYTGKIVRPEDAITAIRQAGGTAVLAHPSFGSGDELIIGTDMDGRLRKLTDFGLQGVEAFYSGFTEKLRDEMLSYAGKYDLYVTAGSDYHGGNKRAVPGDIGPDDVSEMPEGMIRFLRDTGCGIPGSCGTESTAM